MYRYQPPKSAIWGHSLRNMKPVRQKALFNEFLSQAVAEYSFENGILTVLSGSANQRVLRFEYLLDVISLNNSFNALTPPQIDRCLAEIIGDDELIPDLILLQPVKISAWLINGQKAATSSRVTLYYGSQPCISTFLRFDTVEQFQYIKEVLEDLRFCKLNEKHLKILKLGTNKRRRKQ
jgi:hypothetical protein